MSGLTGTGTEVGADETIVSTNKSSSPLLVTGEERENKVVSNNVTSMDTK